MFSKLVASCRMTLLIRQRNRREKLFQCNELRQLNLLRSWFKVTNFIDFCCSRRVFFSSVRFFYSKFTNQIRQNWQLYKRRCPYKPVIMARNKSRWTLSYSIVDIEFGRLKLRFHFKILMNSFLLLKGHRQLWDAF